MSGVIRPHALVILLLGSVLGLVMFVENSVWRSSHLWSSVLMALTQVAPFAGPALALWSALQAGRIREGRLAEVPSIRPWSIRHALWFFPALAVALFLPLVGVGLAWPPGGLEAGMHWSNLLLIVVAQAQLVTMALWGALMGRVLRRVLALPCAVLIPYVITALPEARDNPAWRHLGGMHGACCFVDSQVALPAIVIPLVFHVLLALALLLLFAHPRRTMALLLVGPVVAASAVLHQATGRITDVDGQQVRPTTELVCSGTTPRVCLWPEQASQRPHIDMALARLNPVLQQAGWPLPDEISAARSAVARYEMPPGAQTNSDTAMATVASIVVPRFPACATSSNWTFPEVMGDLAAWLHVQADLPPSPPVSATLAAVLQRPLPQQHAWFRANMAQREQCGVPVVK